MQQSFLNILRYLFDLKMLGTDGVNAFKAGEHEIRQVTFEKSRSRDVISLKTDKPKEPSDSTPHRKLC